MTIGTLFLWLLALLLVLWIFRELRNRLHAALWRKHRKEQIEKLGEDREAYMKMGHAELAALCEWQRAGLQKVLDRAELWPRSRVPEEDAEAYNRRLQALIDARCLKKDQAFIETRKVALEAELAGSDHD